MQQTSPTDKYSAQSPTFTSSSSSTFVYPVKSLLSRRIQPASDQSSNASLSRCHSTEDVTDYDGQRRRLSSERGRAITVADSPSTDSVFTADNRSSSLSKAEVIEKNVSEANISFTMSSRRRSASVSLDPDASASIKRKSRPSRKLTTNFRHFPAESNPPVPGMFISAVQDHPKLANSTSSTGQEAIGAQWQQGNELYQPTARHPPPLPIVARDILATTSFSLLPALPTPPEEIPSLNGLSLIAPPDLEKRLPSPPPFSNQHSSETIQPLSTTTNHAKTPEITASHTYTDQSIPDLPFNPSEYGLVHLPPLPLSTPTSERGSSYRSFGRTSEHSNSSKQSSRHSNSIYTNSGQGSLFSGIKSPRQNGQHSNASPLGSNYSSSRASQTRSSQYQSATGSLTSEDMLVSFRFQHAQDEYGNHVITGREGKLLRCEDEPIHTPGAVQGFGVLIAVDEQEDVLVVRQVSENSTEILGLPPRYLFSLECFTDTLPESQADLLWDNIQFLTEPDLNAEEEENSPHVFMLTGWAAPGTSSTTGGSTAERNSWTCWCAVHRAVNFNLDALPGSGLIIMEFELERDVLNPLYPPATNEVSGALSPGGTSNSSQFGSSNEGSDQTLGRHSSPQTSDSDPSITDRFSPTSSVPTPPPDAQHKTSSPSESIDAYTPKSLLGLQGEEDWLPSAEDIIESTTSRSKPLPALQRLRRMSASKMDSNVETHPDPDGSRGRRGGRRARRANAGVGMMDVFAVMAQINEQLGAAPDLDIFLKVVVGVIKDLTQFHRVMVYQFDESWNGQVVAELVDWSQTHDLYRGLHFPAGDIPAQARELYAINKVRLLYDRSHPTARIVARSLEDLKMPLNLTHSYLRAMSPIHLKCRDKALDRQGFSLTSFLSDLENMGVRASMSVSIMAFGRLWGLITCHSYGLQGMRVSFPVRQMLRLLSQSISRHVERLSYAQRLHTRKLINTMTSDRHPTGYIVSNADDLLGLFDADFGILVIGEGAKILGPNQHGQEILIMAEYLRLKQYETIQASQAVVNDFPDLQLTTGLEVIAGLLYVPLSQGGKDFIAFLRRGQPRQVHWAGKPFKDGSGSQATLEPRKSFKIWSETVAGRCRAWTDEQLETAGVLALVYGKFIEVWRQKESAMQNTTLANLILSNASHEVRTPLNHIINYLELAMNGSLDVETRDNLNRSHAASKSLLFTINDLLDLTRLEVGNETSFSEPFNLHGAIEEATHLYKKEAGRRNLRFDLDLMDSPAIVVGDAKKIRTVVQNLTANALKFTTEGSITVSCTTFGEPEGLRNPEQAAVEIIVADTGCGISQEKLESIFREFEQVESSEPKSNAEAGVGLGLAVVARIVEQLGGQLRVDSKINEGSRFSFLIPVSLFVDDYADASPSPWSSQRRSRTGSVISRSTGHHKEIDDFVEALSSRHMLGLNSLSASPKTTEPLAEIPPLSANVDMPLINVKISDSQVSPIKVENDHLKITSHIDLTPELPVTTHLSQPLSTMDQETVSADPAKLRILIVEDNDINRAILAKRLTMNGHLVVNTTNGQEGLDKVESDRSFDAVLMDIQMPILNGFEATQRIRELEKATSSSYTTVTDRRKSHVFNGRIPIFAVSASLREEQREELAGYGMDGWILKPIDFRRLNVILNGVISPSQRNQDVYHPGCNWEAGGWLEEAALSS